MNGWRHGAYRRPPRTTEKPRWTPWRPEIRMTPSSWDIQMPGMDGYEAARCIRRDASLKALPIIAMTAHAMQGAREKCLEAGMDDYVSKPIDPRALMEALMKWVAPKERGVVSSPRQAGPFPDESGLPKEIAGINLKAALERVGGNKAAYKRILNKFLKNNENFSGEINRVLADGDFDAAERMAHSLKGAAGNLAANDVYRTAADLEARIQSGQTSGLDLMITQISDSLSIIRKAMADIQPAPAPIEDSSGAAAVSDEEVRSIMVEIVQKMDLDIAAAKEKMGRLKELKRPLPHLEEAETALDAYDTEEARRSMVRMAAEMNMAPLPDEGA